MAGGAAAAAATLLAEAAVVGMRVTCRLFWVAIVDVVGDQNCGNGGEGLHAERAIYRRRSTSCAVLHSAHRHRSRLPAGTPPAGRCLLPAGRAPCRSAPRALLAATPLRPLTTRGVIRPPIRLR